MMPDSRPIPVGAIEAPPAFASASPVRHCTGLGVWQIACRSRDLRTAPLAVTLSGHPIVLFRDQRNQAIALEDRCAHRNAPLSIGQVCKGRLQCRYHGWEYDTEGRVARVPALPEGEQTSPGLCVPRFHTLEQDGFIWVAGGATAPAIAPYRFPHLDEDGWTSFTMHTRFRGTVEACLENFLDCPHASFVHRYWFRAPTDRPVLATVRALDDGAIAEYFEEPRKKSMVWWLLSPRGGEMQHTDRFIAPSTSRVDYRFPNGLHYIISSSCTEVRAGEVDVFTVISFRWGRWGPLIRLYFEPLSRHIIRQDVAILAAQQDCVDRFGTAQFRSTAADLLGPHIVAWRRALNAGTPPPAAGEPRSVRIRL